MLRSLIAGALPYPREFAAALRLARLARPVAGVFPRRLRDMVMLATDRPVAAERLAPATYPARGPRRKRVALLPGCARQALDRNVNAATIRLLQRLGCDVVVAPGVGCCGALPLHMGRNKQAQALAGANVAAWSAELANGLDAIVVNASGCGTTVKDYGRLIGGDDARRIGTLARDITEVLDELGLPPGDIGRYRVAYHDACSLRHGQRIERQPRELLARAGFEVLDVPERHFCCGSAGTYNLLQPDIAAALGERKAAHIAGVDPDIVAAGISGAWCRSDASRALRSCTPSNCWIGRQAGQCRQRCATARCADPRRVRTGRRTTRSARPRSPIRIAQASGEGRPLPPCAGLQ